MDLGSIFLILALLVAVIWFISRPFFERQRAVSAPLANSGSEDHERSALLAERDRILNALQELDFDYTLGKIPAEDYPAQRAALLQRGAAALRQLDTLQPGTGSEQDAEQRLEAAVAARRADAAAHSAAARPAAGRPDDDLEAMLASRRRERQEKSAGFCPKCGRPLQKSDRFCPKCGAKI